METTWLEDELVRELLDDESPLFILPNYEDNYLNTSSNSSNFTSNSSFLDQFISSSDNILSEQTGESASNLSSSINYFPSSYMQELLSATSRFVLCCVFYLCFQIFDNLVMHCPCFVVHYYTHSYDETRILKDSELNAQLRKIYQLYFTSSARVSFLLD